MGMVSSFVRKEAFLPSLLVGAISSAEGDSLATGTESIQVQSSRFSSTLRQIAWAGSSARHCDLKCRQGCPEVGVRDTHWSDISRQRTEACMAACGCGGEANQLLVSTEAGIAYVSTDGGSTWRDFYQVASSQRLSERFRVETIHVSYAEPQFVAVLTNTTTSWVSHDGGKSWSPLRLKTDVHGKQKIASWQWHPSEKQLALAESPAASWGDSAFRLVFYTQDAGTSWKLLAEDVERCQWAMAPGSSGSSRLELLASEDLMASHSVLLGEGAPTGGPGAAERVLVRGGWVFALAPPAGLPGGGGPAAGHRLRLWCRAEDGSANPSFWVPRWPANVGPPKLRQLRRLSILAVAEHAALLHLPAGDTSLPWGHVFSLRPRSPDLELVLTDVQRAPGTRDGLAWQSVSGIDGIFIANRAILDRGQDLDEVETQYDAQSQVFERGPGYSDILDEGIGGEQSVISEPQLRLVVRTYISVNMGLAWQPLKVQLQGYRHATGGGCWQSHACHLHLAHWTSSATAPGLLIGVGNAGTWLAQDVAHHNVFVSRNAGLDWQRVLQGPHTIALLGSGDVLAAVPVTAPTTLLYSTDMGGDWRRIPLTAPDEWNLAVQGLFVHPAHTDWRALITLGNDGEAGIRLAVANLSNVIEKSCRLPDDPANVASDFETWSPADALEDAHESKRPVCLLGVRTRYLRRKPNRLCKTGGTLGLTSLDLRNDVPCQCSLADWACDVGFHHVAYSAGASCDPLEGSSQPNISKLCAATVSSHVEVTRGYTKSPGNRCQGGVDLSPRLELCPRNVGLIAALYRAAHRMSHGLMFIATVSVLALLVLLYQTRVIAIGSVSPAWGIVRSLVPSLTKCGRRKSHSDGEDDEEREFLIEPSR